VTDKHGKKQRDTYERLLEDARAELALLTGRDGKAPGEHKADIDSKEGFEKAVKEEAEMGRTAEATAIRFGGNKSHVARIYLEAGFLANGVRIDGKEAKEIAEARRMFGEGMRQTQIAMKLGVDQSTVSRWLRKAAA
jgi:hypothetical protein